MIPFQRAFRGSSPLTATARAPCADSCAECRCAQFRHHDEQGGGSGGEGGGKVTATATATAMTAAGMATAGVGAHILLLHVVCAVRLFLCDSVQLCALYFAIG